MASLLIETKVVKALQVQLEDVNALLHEVHKKPVFFHRPARGEVLMDVGRIVRQPMSDAALASFDADMKMPTPFLAPAVLFQDLVNRGELPEGHYLVNLGHMAEHDGGQVKDYVLKLQAEIAEANAVPA